MKLSTFVLSLVAGMASFSCNQLNKESMEHTTSHAKPAIAFACPMHPEVRGHEGDKCPKCGMALERANVQAKISMTLTNTPGKIESGKEVELVFMPKDESDSTAVVQLQETHEKMIHVIAVSEDLTWFDHIHAEPQNNGAYKVTETFPFAGKYLLYADYKLVDGKHQTDKIEVNVFGAKKAFENNHQSKIRSTTDGYTLSIQNGNKLNTGRVGIPIIIEKDAKKLDRSDIENYLGAVAHIILIGHDDKDFVHIHPESSEVSPVHAHADIMKPGIYRMWVQFQTNGKVHTADFTLNFKGDEEGAKDGKKHSHVEHHH